MTKTSPRFVFVFVHVLAAAVTARGQELVHTVVVKEGDDAVLPCSLSTKADIVTQVFDWKKDGQNKKEEVFMYNAGSHYNNGLQGQDKQFKGRVSHFPDQLKFGNASIKIRQTEIADGGNYTCIFPGLQPRQTFIIELVIKVTLKDRSRENSGAGRPVVTIPDAGQTQSKLSCEVKAASPKPRVAWKDGTGNILHAHEPQVSETGGIYDIIVTKTGRYHCVVTQQEIGHQAAAETSVSFYEPNPHILGWSIGSLIGSLFAGMVIGAGLLAGVLAVLVPMKRIRISWNKREEEEVVPPEKVAMGEA